ncbi:MULTISPECIES: sulfurtransferase TusA family protein [unclassified Methylophaga]|uniref:sulfurtransferase TusA family protein n=1 Tax=unclassified Methylophaga TaxID=2629249 RepID=UPI000C455BD8|nr:MULTISPECIES: sulfurtransferase TusA family protein [unclassified Methylophaga]MAL49855.1 SirA family protein [Methylophaga sp.]MAP27208.1 SirA family protein [Methylophaga sp.]MBP24340.1 SirA family protein [Methylophaga sp.]HCC82871.1 SirA family protein [Methylophaga sp.]HCO00354.1 SirA family protein [Methylophaga sp.]
MKQIELDARRLLCPLPVIKTQNKVAELSSGDILTVICTDPGALSDIPAWARIHGHQIVKSVEKDDEIIITVCVGA